MPKMFRVFVVRNGKEDQIAGAGSPALLKQEFASWQDQFVHGPADTYQVKVEREAGQEHNVGPAVGVDHVVGIIDRLDDPPARLHLFLQDLAATG